ncbi:hypothetical protein ACJX0J_016520, partial [Zea mays]
YLRYPQEKAIVVAFGNISHSLPFWGNLFIILIMFLQGNVAINSLNDIRSRICLIKKIMITPTPIKGSGSNLYKTLEQRHVWLEEMINAKKVFYMVLYKNIFDD